MTTEKKQVKRALTSKKRSSPTAKTAAKAKRAKPVSRPPRLSQDDIAGLAYRLWEERGRPFESADRDWHEAENALRTV